MLFEWISFPQMFSFSLLHAPPYVCDKSKGICSNFHFEMWQDEWKCCTFYHNWKIVAGANERQRKWNSIDICVMHRIWYQNHSKMTVNHLYRNNLGKRMVSVCVHVQKTTRLIFCSLSLFAQNYQTEAQQAAQINSKRTNQRRNKMRCFCLFYVHRLVFHFLMWMKRKFHCKIPESNASYCLTSQWYRVCFTCVARAHPACQFLGIRNYFDEDADWLWRFVLELTTILIRKIVYLARCCYHCCFFSSTRSRLISLLVFDVVLFIFFSLSPHE